MAVQDGERQAQLARQRVKGVALAPAQKGRVHDHRVTGRKQGARLRGQLRVPAGAAGRRR